MLRILGRQSSRISLEPKSRQGMLGTEREKEAIWRRFRWKSLLEGGRKLRKHLRQREKRSRGHRKRGGKSFKKRVKRKRWFLKMRRITMR